METVFNKIHEHEGGDIKVLRLAALLHDVGIVREHNEGGDHAEYSAEIAREFLSRAGADNSLVDHVTSCIQTHRFSRGLKAESIEAQILQDADRIDALGAVGIFRSLVSMGALRALKQTIGTVKETSMNAYTQDPFEGFGDYMDNKPFQIKNRLNTDHLIIAAIITSHLLLQTCLNRVYLFALGSFCLLQAEQSRRFQPQ